jgi:hypothetical protein
MFLREAAEYSELAFWSAKGAEKRDRSMLLKDMMKWEVWFWRGLEGVGGKLTDEVSGLL